MSPPYQGESKTKPPDGEKDGSDDEGTSSNEIVDASDGTEVSDEYNSDHFGGENFQNPQPQKIQENLKNDKRKRTKGKKTKTVYDDSRSVYVKDIHPSDQHK